MSELDDVRDRLNDRITELESELARLKSPMEGAKTTAEEIVAVRTWLLDEDDDYGIENRETRKLLLRCLGDLDHATAQARETRDILAGADYPSLPVDWTLPQIAQARMDDINKYIWQVRDTCTRAEKAEAQARNAAELMEPIADALDENEEEAKRPDRAEIWETPTAMAIELGHVRAIKRHIESIRARRKGETGNG